VALQRGDFEQMRRLLGESISVRLEIGDRSGIAWCLEKLAQAILVQMRAVSEPERLSGYRQTVRILGAAAGLRAPVGSVIDPADEPAYARNLALLRTTLGDEAFASAWDRGEAMPLEAVIAEALAEPEMADAPAPMPEPTEDFAGLTPRERETAVLIAQGKSNREIAEAMTVRLKTIETYVTRILNKLGFESRVQIAVWVVEKGVGSPTDDGD
jgi:non-specific serine/threonine protein kinase